MIACNLQLIVPCQLSVFDIITAYTYNRKDLVEMCMAHNEERGSSEFNTHGICRRQEKQW